MPNSSATTVDRGQKGFGLTPTGLWASLVAQRWRICLRRSRPGFDPWVGEIPWRRAWQPTPVFLPGDSHGWRSLAGCSPQVDTTEARKQQQQAPVFVSPSLYVRELRFRVGRDLAKVTELICLPGHLLSTQDKRLISLAWSQVI